MRTGRGRLVVAVVVATAALVVSGSWASVQPEPTLTRAQVRQVALDWNAQQERATGRILAPVRVARITLVQPGETYRARGGATKNGKLWWAVELEGGTYAGCGGWWCNLYTGGGGIAVSDRAGSCSGNVELCKQSSKDLLSRVGAAWAGTRHLGPIPLHQAMHGRAASAPPRSAAAARKIALRYLGDNEVALGSSLPSATAARVVSLTRLQPGQVHIVDRRQGGFKAGPPTWIARVEGTLANCIDDYPESKGYDKGTPTDYGTRQCTLASTGYLGIADDRTYPTAVIMTGRRTTVPLTAIAPSCTLTRLERIVC